eukprot:m.644252 g.644252  ORF g.644252 m.644252 type:complete len:302 (-) comp22647_c0_seq15:2696-3601(-)
MSETMNKHLSEAERLWRANDRSAAVKEYDAAVDIAREQFPEKVGEILLGKGFALMQVDETSRDGVRALKEAQDIAKTSGNQAQVDFVQMLIDNKGGIPGVTDSEHSHRDDAGCSDVSHCDDTFENLTQNLKDKGDVLKSDWYPEADACLIKLVADNGTGDWDLKAVAISSTCGDKIFLTPSPLHRKSVEIIVDGVAGHSVTQPINGKSGGDNGDGSAAERADNGINDNADVSATLGEAVVGSSAVASLTGRDVEEHWLRIAPRVRAELSDPTSVRACGHTCGTCPTRSTCKLHDVLDIEDM